MQPGRTLGAVHRTVSHGPAAVRRGRCASPLLTRIAPPVYRCVPSEAFEGQALTVPEGTGLPVIDNAFNNDDSLVGKALNRAAHLMPYAIGAVAVACIFRYVGVDHWLISATEHFALACVVIGMLHHIFTRLCIRCMEEVPADASHQAQRQSRVLWLNHLIDSMRGIVVYLVAVIGYSVLLGAMELPPVASLPLDAFYVAFMYSIWLHHRLRPWCPYCRRWDDGGGIVEPSPDPMIKATK